VWPQAVVLGRTRVSGCGGGVMPLSKPSGSWRSNRWRAALAPRTFALMWAGSGVAAGHVLLLDLMQGVFA
jgi:hypothetical protein